MTKGYCPILCPLNKINCCFYCKDKSHCKYLCSNNPTKCTILSVRKAFKAILSMRFNKRNDIINMIELAIRNITIGILTWNVSGIYFYSNLI